MGEVFVRTGKAKSMEQIHELIRKGKPEEISRQISDSDKMDILFDSKNDHKRREISGALAVKLSNAEVIRLQRKAKGLPEE